MTLFPVTADVNFFPSLVMKSDKFAYSNKGKQTTFASHVYENGRHGNKTYLMQGILLFKIRDRLTLNILKI